MPNKLQRPERDQMKKRRVRFFLLRMTRLREVRAAICRRCRVSLKSKCVLIQFVIKETLHMTKFMRINYAIMSLFLICNYRKSYRNATGSMRAAHALGVVIMCFNFSVSLHEKCSASLSVARSAAGEHQWSAVSP